MGKIFGFELRRNIKKWALWIILLYLLGAMSLFQLGIVKYKVTLDPTIKFSRTEEKNVLLSPNYSYYATMGFNLIAAPSPLTSVFENSLTFGNMGAFLDARTKLYLIKFQVDSNIFNKTTGGMLDLSWYILMIGSLMVLSWGFFTFKNIDYMRFLMNFTSPRKVYGGIILARILILTGAIAITGLVSFIQFLLNGITLSPGELTGLLTFYLVVEMVLVFVLLVGSIFGMIKNTYKGAIMAMFFWLILFLLWPEVLNSILVASSNNAIKSCSDIQAQKLNILMGFEKSFNEKIKNLKKNAEIQQASKEWSESYWNNEFKQIENLESEMVIEKKKFIDKFHFSSIFTPVTCFKAMNVELSSCGYNSYISFNKWALEKQKGFLRYYFDKRFYENDPVVKPYLKDDEYIYRMKPSLSKYFGLGLVLNLVYLLVAFGFSYFCFLRLVFPKELIPGMSSDMDMNFLPKKHYLYSYQETSRGFFDQVYNALKGHMEKYSGKMAINGKEIAFGEKKDFFFLPEIGTLPGNLKLTSYIDLIGGWNRLSDEDKKSLLEKAGGDLDRRYGDIDKFNRARVLVQLGRIKKIDFFLLYNFLDDINYDDVQKFFVEMRKEKPTIIEFYKEPSYYISESKINAGSNIRLEEGKYMEVVVKAL